MFLHVIIKKLLHAGTVTVDQDKNKLDLEVYPMSPLATLNPCHTVGRMVTPCGLMALRPV